MKTLSYSFVDKAAWGPGPWMLEPDKIQWPDSATGLPCLAVRGPVGSWCGYVGVGPDHHYFEKDYDAFDVSVHGGLSYADFCAPEDKEHGICHLTELGENDRIWWFGFDCHHCDDLAPAFELQLDQINPERRFSFQERQRHYWTLGEVRMECASLAAQLAQL